MGLNVYMVVTGACRGKSVPLCQMYICLGGSRVLNRSRTLALGTLCSGQAALQRRDHSLTALQDIVLLIVHMPGDLQTDLNFYHLVSFDIILS